MLYVQPQKHRPVQISITHIQHPFGHQHCWPKMDVSRPYRAQALWETTSRLLATIVNEGLVECPAELSLPVSPRAWRPPVFDKPDGISNVNTWSVAGFGDLDLSSEAIFESLLSRFECEPTVKDQIIAELRSSVIFQGQLLREAQLLIYS